MSWSHIDSKTSLDQGTVDTHTLRSSFINRLFTSTDSDNQSSYWSTSLRSLEAKQMTKSEDSEKYIQDAEKYVPSDKRHVQIIAVGQTGMGKTRTMNRTFGTMATEAVPGQGVCYVCVMMPCTFTNCVV